VIDIGRMSRSGAPAWRSSVSALWWRFSTDAVRRPMQVIDGRDERAVRRRQVRQVAETKPVPGQAQSVSAAACRAFETRPSPK